MFRQLYNASRHSTDKESGSGSRTLSYSLHIRLSQLGSAQPEADGSTVGFANLPTATTTTDGSRSRASSMPQTRVWNGIGVYKYGYEPSIPSVATGEGVGLGRVGWGRRRSSVYELCLKGGLLGYTAFIDDMGFGAIELLRLMIYEDWVGVFVFRVYVSKLLKDPITRLCDVLRANAILFRLDLLPISNIPYEGYSDSSLLHKCIRLVRGL